MKKTNTQKAIDLIKSGRKHSRELNNALGWDWRKYISNAKKKLLEEGIELKTEPDGKYNWYYIDQHLTAIQKERPVFGDKKTIYEMRYKK